MLGDSQQFDFDLRVSVKPVAIAMGVTSIGLVLVASAVPAIGERAIIALLAVCVAALGFTAWWLEKRATLAGRWIVVVAAVLLPFAVVSWLHIPAALILQVLPVALAAILIGIRSAAGVAAVVSLWTVLLTVSSPALYSATTSALLLVTTWALVGVLFGEALPVRQFATWAWQHYQHASAMLNDAQNLRVELAQVVEDLEQANLQLARLNNVAQGLRSAAEEARTVKEQFVANVSHELRTPLNMITGFSEMILQAPETYGGLPPTLLADLAVIHRNAEHLAHLIDDVLDLSQVEAEQMAVTKESVRFDELVEHATMAVRPLFESKGLTLETEVPSNLPLVYCDPVRIREVVLNLLSNAGRFTERGGVRLRAWTEAEEIFVSVTDTGPGISKADMQRIFQPFHQIDASIRRRYGGTGLGLAISKRFVELHDGHIWAESEPGVGTTVALRLPLSPPLPSGMGQSHRRGILPDWEFLQRTRPRVTPQQVIRPHLHVFETGTFLQNLLSRYGDGVKVSASETLPQLLEQLGQEPVEALIVNETSLRVPFAELSSTAKLPGEMPIIRCAIPGSELTGDSESRTERLIKPISKSALLGTLNRLGITEGHILIVDDEPDARQLFGRMLKATGSKYRVLFARDGQEALEVIADRRPQAILIDLVMPNMDGYQFLERRSQNAELRTIPAVIISARDPAGQPIVSNRLTVTLGDGISTHKMLRCISTLTNILSVKSPANDQVLPADQPAELASV